MVWLRTTLLIGGHLAAKGAGHRGVNVMITIFLKNNVMINFEHKLAAFWLNITYYFSIFWRKYFKNDHNIDP
jgi:hypothetical protein